MSINNTVISKNYINSVVKRTVNKYLNKTNLNIREIDHDFNLFKDSNIQDFTIVFERENVSKDGKASATIINAIFYKNRDCACWEFLGFVGLDECSIYKNDFKIMIKIEQVLNNSDRHNRFNLKTIERNVQKLKGGE